eukprot:TRINITY_DN12716_c0_g1_i1.p1 TRINITY_DN12716_c0_g1~~TRINITY_DN12716_c0_g1_i1.p1  ORF type:complete len:442 (-),score=71.38 TRINITY_DN12716_c0_g1_i1:11-1159(-)
MPSGCSNAPPPNGNFGAPGLMDTGPSGCCSTSSPNGNFGTPGPMPSAQPGMASGYSSTPAGSAGFGPPGPIPSSFGATEPSSFGATGPMPAGQSSAPMSSGNFDAQGQMPSGQSSIQSGFADASSPSSGNFGAPGSMPPLQSGPASGFSSAQPGAFDGQGSQALALPAVGQQPGLQPGPVDAISPHLQMDGQGLGSSHFGGPAAGGPSQYFRGVIRAFDKEKGWGHIASAQSHLIYNRDIFVLASGFLSGNEVLVGDEVEFTVVTTAKGPQASNVSFVNKPVVPLVNTKAGTERYFGVIRAFDMSKGWGHIECRESRTIYGRDIFLLRSKLNGAEVTAGNQVEFSVEIGPKGPQAKDVCLVDYGPTMAEAIKFRLELQFANR